MKCLICNDTMRKEKVTFTGKTDTAIILIKNVQANKCPQCGEELFDEAEMVLIGRIVDVFRNVPLELAITDAAEWKIISK